MNDQPEAEVLDVVEDVVETTEVQTDNTSETVSDSGESHEEKPTFSPEQKAAADYAFKAREAKREAEELRKQLEEAQKPKDEGKPVIPEIDDYASAEEIKARDEAIKRAALWDYQQEQQKEADYQAQVTAQTRQQEEITKVRNDFVTNSTKAGIKLEDLQVAGNVVDAHGLNPVIAQAIMSDKEGGLALLHLATNPADIQALNNANALTLGTIYTDIKSKAAELKPKQADTPKPPEVIDGAGAPSTNPALDGVVFS